MLQSVTKKINRLATMRPALTACSLCLFVYFMLQLPKDSVRTDIRDKDMQLEVMNEKMVERYFNGTVDDDPKLITYVRSRKIIPPSNKPYNLSDPDVIDGSQYGQPKVIEKYLHNMTGGFFVEVGAYDGEKLSNSLYFERFLNWNGLLIEANPDLFRRLLTKNRKSYSIHACLSLHTVAETLNFVSAGFNGRIVEGQGKGDSLQCFPLYTLMLALGRSQIDYFSLDIEGDELKVLKTIPWDKLQIRLLEIEVVHTQEGREAVKKYMESVGYTFLQSHYIDMFFGKKDLLDQLKNNV